MHTISVESALILHMTALMTQTVRKMMVSHRWDNNYGANITNLKHWRILRTWSY